MEEDSFTTSQVANILNIPLRKIIAYTERGYIEASLQGPSGYGSRRLWSLTDLEKIQIIRTCEAFGLSPRFLRRLCSLLTMEELNLRSNLIIDGSGHVFNSENSVADVLVDGHHSPCLFIF
jgi:DNA-binding transcriptional MerR regulator